LLLISQFTLYGDTSHGRRPSFIEAEEPEHANELYKLFIEKAKQSGLKVEKGIFGADMKVDLLNNGPVTLIIESKS
jgi:D-tyrosyl-tRNA(Tyr) deacylase